MHMPRGLPHTEWPARSVLDPPQDPLPRDVSLQGLHAPYTLHVDPREQDVARIVASLAPLPSPRRAPALTVLCGLPGSGKSTVAEALRARVPVALVQSDRVRKLLIDAPTYTTDESARVFGAIHAVVERLLSTGIPVILDATTLLEQQRAPLASIASRTRARLILVWVYASDAEVRRRLIARQHGKRSPNDVSDAGVEIYEMMRERVEPIRGPHWRIDTGRGIERIVDALARRIEGTSGARGPLN
jgi:predicted kinase